MEIKYVKDIKPGEMFRREGGDYRYVASNKRDGYARVYCYKRAYGR